jgi:type I restriction enzyme S subunit
MSKYPSATISEIVIEGGVFTDGDWIESKDQNDEGTIRLIQLADIGDGEFINKSDKHITEMKAIELNCTILKAGDILVARMPDPIGRACIFPDFDYKCVTAVDVCIIRPNNPNVFGKWLMHIINSPKFRNNIQKYSTGTTRKRISRKNLAKIEFPLPPLVEQKRIATILDQVDALRRKREQSLSHLDDLMQSVFLKMFGDPILNPKNWDQKELGEIVNNEDSKRIPVKLADRKKMQGEFPYYGASGIIDYVDDYLFEGESLLIAEDGANLISRTTPIAFIANGKYWVNNHAHVLRFSGLADLFYLEYFFKFIDLSPYLTGSAQPKLNQKNLNRIPILLPPLNLQVEFRERIALIHKQEIIMKRSQEMLDDLFLSLQQSAFSGHLNFPVEGNQQNQD